jgi:uncharacterized protein YutE (UPF0331/DUF86 family)
MTQNDETDYRQILINLCAGACLADHMGDMGGDVIEALEQAKLISREEAREAEDLNDITRILVKKYNAKTLYGTDLGDDNE